MSRFGSEDHAQVSDCIIVLGAAVRGDRPSPVFEQRLNHAILLHRAGMAPKVILTGGIGQGTAHAESEVGSTFVQSHGIPAEAILTESKSHTTQRNLAEAAALMTDHHLHTAIVVSDPDHMKRAILMAENLGMSAVSSPTRTSRFQSWKTRLPFLLREVYFFHHHLVTGD
ncbi:MAG: YdcF family protein [Verrucomicrobiaceae bacterium]|nr:MAG: YdcF family protein [Verrucomicrobiaceae bacterium]